MLLDLKCSDNWNFDDQEMIRCILDDVLVVQSWINCFEVMECVSAYLNIVNNR